MRLWIGLGSLAVALLFGFIARAVDGAAANALYFVSGVAFLIAIGIAVAAIPIWHRLGWRLPETGALFVKPGPGEVWSQQEGKPVPREQVRTKRQ